MENYVKPEFEILKLRVEERIAICSNEQLKSQNEYFMVGICSVPLPIEGVGMAGCYDMTDCS